MTMFDMTAIICGDPSAAFRRPPTEEEARHAARMSSYVPKRGPYARQTPLTVVCQAVPVGGVLRAHSEDQAARYARWFSDRDRYARIKKQNANLWTVTRVR